ncbi:MAG: glycosyltransferase [Bacteroidetes bacterium]|nr:glycosyltransferase [Bacteroidota bacterium]
MSTLLQINTVCNSGSTGRIAEEIGLLAIRNGWQSYIAFGRGNPVSKSQTYRIGTDINLYTNAFIARLFDNDGFAVKQATVQLIQFIYSICPDVIHLHNLHGYYLNTEVLFDFLAKKDIPVLWTLHDCWPMTGHCTYFDHVQCDRWKTGCFACPQKKEYPASLVFDNSQKNYLRKKRLFTSIKNMRLITPSTWLSELVKESFLQKYPVQVINNGVDLNKFHPRAETSVRRKYGAEAKKIILGVANIWDERKGLTYFIDLEKLLSDNEKIILVGLTPRQIRQLPAGILGLERTESIEELAALYSAADVFVNPSSEETFGLTTVEAMACGTPVVVLDATASPELVSPGTGLVVSKGDVQGLYEAVVTILRKGRGSYTTACIERARQLYDSAGRYQDYFSVYQRMEKSQQTPQVFD